MDYTTLPLATRAVTAPETVPVVSLYKALQKLSDPRRAQGKRSELALILCLVVLAKLAGQKTLSGATEWIRHRSSALAQRFGLRREQMPCQMTYCNVLAMVDSKQLDEILAAFFVRWEAQSRCGEEPSLCWLHVTSAEKIESFPLQLPSSLTTDMHIESRVGEHPCSPRQKLADQYARVCLVCSLHQGKRQHAVCWFSYQR
jgi:hypothetical protein